MLTWTPADSSRPVNDDDVNCTPWSVLNTSGQPRPSASSNASRQNATSSVFDSRHDSTYRLYQSITAVRYMNPFGMGIYVISVLHTWFTRSIDTFRSRYGYTLCPAPPTDNRGFGYTASRPIKRISRCTRLRLTSCPARRSHDLMPRLPRKGWSVYSLSISAMSAKFSTDSVAGS